MDRVTLFARAKINLALDAIEKLEDGYHSLITIMQTINIIDKIIIVKKRANFNKQDKNGISIKTNVSWLPVDDKNIVYRAALYLKQNYNIKENINIFINKNIPISAGLAGGSSDCAASLIGIRNLFRLPISSEELLKMSELFGADVPFCVLRGTALAKGKGERITPLSYLPRCYIVVAKPRFGLSTAQVFENLDLNNIPHPDIEKIIYYLKKQKLKKVCENLCNVLETVTIPKHPVIRSIKNFMIENGALGSLMSGSGSSVFGIYPSKKEAILAFNQLKYRYKFKEIFLTTPFNNYNI